MRVATFNILNGRVPTDQHVDLAGFREAVQRLDCDVLAMQEVDRNQHRSDHADLTAIAAEVMQARDHRFVAALSGSVGATWVAATGQEQPDAAAYGLPLPGARVEGRASGAVADTGADALLRPAAPGAGAGRAAGGRRRGRRVTA